MKTSFVLVAVLMLASQTLAQAATATSYSDNQFCSADCKTCNAKKCLTCHLGFYLNGDVCESCANNCLKCTSNEFSTCTECAVGFLKTYNSCQTYGSLRD